MRALAFGALLAAAPAQAAEGQLLFDVGWRQSVDLNAGGLSFGAGLGLWLGPIGFEYQGTFANDHTFKAAESRIAGRNTNWLDLKAGLPVGEVVRLWLGVGGGLGWIKHPGKAERAYTRDLSAGFHERLGVDLRAGDDDAGLVMGLTLEGQHLWQDAVDLPRLEHAVVVHLRMGLFFAER